MVEEEVLDFCDVSEQRVPMLMSDVHGLSHLRIDFENTERVRKAVVHIAAVIACVGSG